MALNFPSNPSENDVYQFGLLTYIFKNGKWVSQSRGASQLPWYSNMEHARSFWKRLAAEAGLNLVDGSFEEGAYLTGLNDVVWWQAGAAIYGWHLDEAKTIPAGSTPATSGGIGAGAWVDRSDVVLRNELSSDNGSTLIGWVRGIIGSIRTTVWAWLGWQPVSPFEFMTPAQIADVQAGTLTIDVTDAVQAAFDTLKEIYLPAGQYLISRPLRLSTASRRIKGCGMNSSVLVANSTFASATIGGDTGYAVIWYQAPGLASGEDWIEGGEFSDFGINCNSVKGVREIDGIRVNRVAINQSFRNLKISNAGVGIKGTRQGFITKFDNVFIYTAIHAGVQLNYGYNGCTFNNCYIFGATTSPMNEDGSWTEVLLDIKNNCLGNIYNGGAIEGGRVAVRLSNQAQLSVNGTDFEEITEKFAEISGNYVTPPYGDGLYAANPTSSFYGCNFVGAPSVSGIEVHGGSVSVDGCFFINSGAVPAAGVYALNGIEGGDVTITGFERLCISESNNTARGWGNQFCTGYVASRMARVITGGVTFPTPAIASDNYTTLDDYREGVFTPTDASGAGLVFTNASGAFTKIGNMVFGTLEVTFPANSNGAAISIGGLPYAAAASSTYSPNRGGLNVSWNDSGLTISALLNPNATTLNLYSNLGVAITNADMSGKSMWITLSYRV